MAHIERFGSYVVLALSKREKFFSLHSSPRAKFGEIMSVRKVSKAWSWTVMRGIRAPGTGIPRVFALGTWRYHQGKNFMFSRLHEQIVSETFGISLERSF